MVNVRVLLVFITLLISNIGFSQSHLKRVLFLGNSYTTSNNLPQMIADMAASAGDSLVYDMSAPGGITFMGHLMNGTSLIKLDTGNWDVVVLQEQSQLPSFPDAQVESDVFPYAHVLDSLVRAPDSCRETMFFMTWGRKNGDASNCAVWPPVCTYAGMDSLLCLRYTMMADTNHAVLSPVGQVWKYIRQNHPFTELYQPDESHPSVAGTYAAACTFYAALYRKNPLNITFNSSLSAAEALDIRTAAKVVVYDSLLKWNIGLYDPLAGFTPAITGFNEVTFTNNSMYSGNFFWDFGDGGTSVQSDPVHVFPWAGPYTITLFAEGCGMMDMLIQTIQVGTVGLPDLSAQKIRMYPNPAENIIESIIPSGNFRYDVLASDGQMVFSGRGAGPLLRLDLSGLQEGLYTVTMIFDSGVRYAGRFIKH